MSLVDSIAGGTAGNIASAKTVEIGTNRRSDMKFEYAIFIYDLDVTNEWLNEKGSDGWELVAVIPLVVRTQLVFKKALSKGSAT